MRLLRTTRGARSRCAPADPWPRAGSVFKETAPEAEEAARFLVAHRDRDRAQRVAEAMLKMKKLDFAGLEVAYRGDQRGT